MHPIILNLLRVLKNNMCEVLPLFSEKKREVKYYI